MKKTLFTLLFCLSTVQVILFGQAQFLDPDFGQNGIVIPSFTDIDHFGTSLALQPDGKIIIGGVCRYKISTNEDFFLTRLLPNGEVDKNFAINGKRVYNLGSPYDWVNAVAVQPDGKILAAGRTEDLVSQKFAFGLARFTEDGFIDSDFGSLGIARHRISDFDMTSCMSLQPDGKIVVGGYLTINSKNWLGLLRFTTTGQLDSTFGVNGAAKIDVPATGGRIHAMTLQPDGKILVTGYFAQKADGSDNAYFLSRMLTNGAVDKSFGQNGFITGYFSDSKASTGQAIALQPDGKILVTGDDLIFTTHRPVCIARHLPDGSPDPAFAGDGTSAVYLDNCSFYGRGIIVMPNGKIVVGGTAAYVYPDTEMGLHGFLPDGKIDDHFGSNGFVSNNIGSPSASGSDDYHFASILQPDGKILSVGRRVDSTAVLRYLSSLNVGTLDFTELNYSTQVYPNPLSTQSVLEFELSSPETLSVQLFDLKGKIVAEILTGEVLLTGKHRIPIALHDHLPSGAYLLRISNGKGARSIKVFK